MGSETIIPPVPQRLSKLLNADWPTSLDYVVVYTWHRDIVKNPDGTTNTERTTEFGHTAMRIVKRSANPSLSYISFYPEEKRLRSPGYFVASLDEERFAHSPEQTFLPGNNDGRSGLNIPAMYAYWLSFKDNHGYWTALGNNCALVVKRILIQGGIGKFRALASMPFMPWDVRAYLRAAQRTIIQKREEEKQAARK